MKGRQQKNLSKILLLLTLINPPLNLSAQSFEKEAEEKSKLYSKTEVLEIVAAVEREAEISIAESYAEGFKAGVLEIEPERAFLEAVNSQLAEDLENERKKKKKSSFLWAAVAFCAGAFAGSVVVMVVN